eukprot:156383-Ditylum_brightwellii.AAC.1
MMTLHHRVRIPGCRRRINQKTGPDQACLLDDNAESKKEYVGLEWGEEGVVSVSGHGESCDPGPWAQLVLSPDEDRVTDVECES